MAPTKKWQFDWRRPCLSWIPFDGDSSTDGKAARVVGAPAAHHRQVKIVKGHALPVDVELIGGPAVVVGVAPLKWRRGVAWHGGIAPVAPDRNGAAVRHGDVARFRCRDGASSHQPGKEEWPGVE